MNKLYFLSLLTIFTSCNNVLKNDSGKRLQVILAPADKDINAKELFLAKKIISKRLEIAEITEFTCDVKEGRIILTLHNDINPHLIKDLIQNSGALSLEPLADGEKITAGLSLWYNRYPEDSILNYIKRSEPLFPAIDVSTKDTQKISTLLVSPKIANLFPNKIFFLWDKKTKSNDKNTITMYAIESSPLSLKGDFVKSASIEEDEINGSYSINVELTPEGTGKFGSLTHKADAIAIIFYGKVLSAPRVLEPIMGGKIVISGAFNETEANNLLVTLLSGSLTTKLNIVEENIIEIK